jgi:hypothetical protein
MILFAPVGEIAFPRQSLIATQFVPDRRIVLQIELNVDTFLMVSKSLLDNQPTPISPNSINKIICVI